MGEGTRMVRLRRCLRWAAAVLCFAGLPTAASAEVAWWLTERFTPAQTSYEGLSARELHPKWEKFSILSNEALPAKAKPDLEWMRKHGLAFTREGDFNGNGLRDRAVTGVYLDAAGRSGRFLLVLEQNRGRWRKAFLSTDPGEPGFSILSGHGQELYWGPCMECDIGSRVKPRGKSYVLAPGGQD
jgi:hypothetical protein